MKNRSKVLFGILGALFLAQTVFAVMTFGPEGVENYPLGGKPNDFNKPTEPKHEYNIVGTPENNQPAEVTRGIPGVHEFDTRDGIKVIKDNP